MKKMKLYEINEGYDGFIVAKSLKQAINLISPYCKPTKKNEILKQCKNPDWDNDWLITDIAKVGKHKCYKKSQVLGFQE